MILPLRRIAIEETGSHLLVAVSLSQLSFLLVLDTGASRTVLDLAFLQGLDLNSNFEIQEDQSVGVGSSTLESHVVCLPDFKLGELEVPNYECACMDLTHVKGTYAKLGLPEVQGVLGSDLLERFEANINYKRLELELSAQ